MKLRLILAAQSRLREVHTTPRVKHLLLGRGYFEEALRWMEIHGGVSGRELAAHWRTLGADHAPPRLEEGEIEAAPQLPAPRRGRRRRRRRPGAPPVSQPPPS